MHEKSARTVNKGANGTCGAQNQVAPAHGPWNKLPSHPKLLRRCRTVRQSAHFLQLPVHCENRANIAEKSAHTVNKGTNGKCGTQNQIAPA